MEESINTVSAGLGTVADDTYNYMNTLAMNPTVMVILVVVVMAYVILFIGLGGGESDTNLSGEVSNPGSSILTIIFIICFIILLVINGIQYVFGVDIVAKLKNVLTPEPEVEITVEPSRKAAAKNDIPQLLLKPQVFNIPGNDYVYSDAKALCSAYGARLATYKELEDSYKEGGEWCNYGWSDGQMALYPTQQDTFDALQKIEGHENDCGRPGINGGYIANPAVRFGVNCYGYKPRMTAEEEDLMANNPIYPKTLKDVAMENRVKYWKDKLTEIIVSPFNKESWSKL
jgi:hypothetical protein